MSRGACHAEPGAPFLSLCGERAEGLIGVFFVLWQAVSVTSVGSFRPGLVSHRYSLTANCQTSSVPMSSGADRGAPAALPRSRPSTGA